MKKTHLIITAVLVIATALIASFYLKGRHQAPEGSLAVIRENKETTIDPFAAPVADVTGTTVNGKGQEKEISEKGVKLSDVLSLAGLGKGDYSAVRVVSSDEYAAEMKGIWSSCIAKDTLDESPMAYKSLADIVEVIRDTVDILDIMKPVYNFKAP